MNILVSMPAGPIRDSFLDADVKQMLNALGRVTWNESASYWSAEEMRRQLRDIEVCLTGWGALPFDETLLSGADQLKLVVHTGGSVGGLATPALFRRGIRIVSGNDGYARSVAEGVLAYMLLALRRIPHYRETMQRQGWRELHFQNEGLLGQTVGLVGFGSVSRYLIELLKPFQVQIMVYSRHLTSEQAEQLGIRKVELEVLLRTCKIVSLHAAATPQNHHLLDKDRLEMLQDGALLINTARGDLIDEAALAELLRARPIRAVLDVFEREPLPKDSPLRGLENVILMPHMAGPTVDQRPIIGKRLVEEIRRFQSGVPLTMEIAPDRARSMTQRP